MNRDHIGGVTRGNAPVPLSVLDLASVGEGLGPERALRNSVELAKVADRRGYHRMWVAEHHSMLGAASSSPAVMIGHLLAHTRRLRLGSGGVMLSNHSALIVAEQFGLLHALAPGRVDLGIGRAAGTDPATAAALRQAHHGEDGAQAFVSQIGELVRFLDDDFPVGHPYHSIHAIPGPAQGTGEGLEAGARRPPVWLLGSSGFSAELAGMLGLPFSFAHHIAPHNTVAGLAAYRKSFRPSPWLDRPYASISVPTLAAEDAEQARREARTGALQMFRVFTGRHGKVPTQQDASAVRLSPEARNFVDRWLVTFVHGTAETVKAGLNELVERTGADELVLTANTHTPEARRRSYELVADAYGFPEEIGPEEPATGTPLEKVAGT